MCISYAFPCDVNVPGPHFENHQFIQLEVGDSEKKNTKLFFTLYKIYLLFHILQTLGRSLPGSWKGCSK